MAAANARGVKRRLRGRPWAGEESAVILSVAKDL